jgi:hypothetical protein
MRREHRAAVRADAEKDDVAERHVAGVAAEQVPAVTHRREHQDVAEGQLEIAVVQRGERQQQGHDRERHGEGLRAAGDAAEPEAAQQPVHAVARPMMPVGRATSTISNTTSAITSCRPLPLRCWPRDRHVQLRRERLDDAVDQAADQRALDAAQTAEHADHERLDQERLAHRRIHAVRQAEQRAGRTGQARAETEGHRVDVRDRTPASCAAPTSIAIARMARPSLERTSQSCIRR